MSLTFDAESHRYELDGEPIPSVTQIINRFFPWVPPPGMSEADIDYVRQRGIATHHGCRLYDEGRLDMETVHEGIYNRLEAWRSFRRSFNMPIVANELMMAHETYRFAGTTDRVCDDNYLALWTIVDIKSSIEPAATIQLGGYSLLWRHASPEVRNHRGVIVALADDGTFQTKWIDKANMKRAEQTFLACLSLFNFALANGLKGSHDR